MALLNGRAPEALLTKVDGIHLAPSIADRVRAIIAAGKAAGYTIHVMHPYGGYRNRDEQAAVQVSSNAASTVPIAAVGASTHGNFFTGRVDLGGPGLYGYDPRTLAWLVVNCSRFGLAREFGSRDPNHFIEAGAFSAASVNPITPGPPAAPQYPSTRRPDMIPFLYAPLVTWKFLIGDGRIKNAPNDQAEFWLAVSTGSGVPMPGLWGVNSAEDLAKLLYSAGFAGTTGFLGYDELTGAQITSADAEGFIKQLSGGRGAIASYRHH